VSGLAGGSAKRLWMTGGSIAALVIGFGGGAWAHAAQIPSLLDLAQTLGPIGTVWSNGLRLIVLPLVVAQLLYCLVAERESANVGRISGLAVLVFGAMLVVGGGATVLSLPWILAQINFSPEALDAFRSAVVDGPRPKVGAAAGFGSWLVGLIPTNILAAASADNLVGVLVFTVAFGIAVSRMPSPQRRLVADFSRTVSDAMMIIVGWLMWVMPVAVLALSLSTAARGGLGSLEVVVKFVVLVCAVMIFWTLLCYPLAAIGGRVSIVRFARAMVPVHLVAVSTRSSIASLPALLESADTHLGLRREVSGVVMPLAVSTFKFNYPITSPVQFLLVAYVYGVDISVAQAMTFVLGIVVLSFASLGIPNGGSLMRAAPFYVAAGVPIEGYLLTEAVEAIPDVFKTLTNVTGDLTAATLVNRLTAPDAVSNIGAAVERVPVESA
jgi:proton glutamate symport protein